MEALRINTDLKFSSSAAKKVNVDLITPELEKEFEELISLCKETMNSVNEKMIKKAFIICIDANQDRLRLSGRPSYYHNIEVAKIAIKDIHLDDISVVVALLHNILARENYTVNTIKQEFGQTIASIVEGLYKIRTLETKRRLESNHLENFRKLLLSLSTDVRIILIKLAVRLQNMRTLKFLPIEKQKEISHETMEIYVPFSNRFGLRNIKWELEDLSFKYTNPEAFSDIKARLSETRRDRENYIKKLLQPVKRALSKDPLLKSQGVEFEVKGRVKHIYSIFNKMHARGKPLEELYDLIAMRVVLNTNDNNLCFYVYGLIASIYDPIPETFKDYINSPKKNGYQSIHTALLGPQKKPVELQLRTLGMHDFAEEGMAAHFNYKRGLLPVQTVFNDSNVNAWLDSVKSLFENSSGLSNKEVLESLKKNLFFEEIHVFTPTNEIRTLPLDSTTLDFAFDIHSEIGIHCIGAKVNGKSVPIETPLKSGDQVEVITSNNHFPEKEWLKKVITPKAKSGINSYLKSLRKKKREEGNKLWEEILIKENINLKEMQFKELYKSMNYSNKGDFFIDISDGKIIPDKLLDYLKYKIVHGFYDKNLPKLNSEVKQENIIISGEDREGLISEILDVLIKINGIYIQSVNYENFDTKFETKINMEIPGNMKIKQHFREIYKIGGINSIRKVI